MTYKVTVRDIAIQLFKNGLTATKIFLNLAKMIPLRTIQLWIQLYQQSGRLEKLKTSGRPRVVRTLDAYGKIKRLIGKNSPRQISSKLNVSLSSVQRALKDLNLNAYRKQKIPNLTEKQIMKRVSFCRWWRKNNGDGIKKLPIIFSDEKQCCLGEGVNRKNNVVYARNIEEANKKGRQYGVDKFPLSVMVWCGLTTNGPTKPYFFKENETLTQDNYRKKILPLAKKEGKRLFASDKWAFQQDGASSHTSNVAQNWCMKNLFKFIAKDKWPPNSPDLNPLDYYFWNAVTKQIKSQKIENREKFIKETDKAIKNVPIDEIKKACDSFTRRVREVEEVKGNYCHK